MRYWVDSGQDFFQLCTTYRHSAWRWECQGVYHEPDEQEPLQRWREGRPDNSFLSGWLSVINRLRAEGKLFNRVRMVTDPPTDYLRWMFSFTHLNIEAGEEIRWIDQQDLPGDGAPEYDYYLLDDERVAVVTFGDNGVVGAEVTDDAHVVERHRQWRDFVWPIATPHGESQYATRSL